MPVYKATSLISRTLWCIHMALVCLVLFLFWNKSMKCYWQELFRLWELNAKFTLCCSITVFTLQTLRASKPWRQLLVHTRHSCIALNYAGCLTSSVVLSVFIALKLLIALCSSKKRKNYVGSEALPTSFKERKTRLSTVDCWLLQGFSIMLYVRK